jgi:hypothetical protein
VSGWSVAPPAGLRGGGDERLVLQVAEADLIAGGERVRIGERDPAGLGEQHLDPYVVLAREWQPQQPGIDIHAIRLWRRVLDTDPGPGQA